MSENHPNVNISTFYMIGDNTASDIEGANRQGKLNLKKNGVNNWKSILLKTGVYKDGEDTNNAEYVV